MLRLHRYLPFLLVPAGLGLAQETGNDAQQGIPQPPTGQEVSALPPEIFAEHSKAIKLVMLEQMVRAKENNRRVTPDDLLACAELAKKLQAPSCLAQLLQHEASDQLSARDRHTLRVVLTAFLQAYRVDETALRYYVEGSHLPPDALRDSFTWLPLAHLFNRLPLQKPSFQQMENDFIELGRIAGERCQIFSNINSTEQADEAALALAPLLARHAATLATRMLADKEDQKRLQARYGLMTKTILQRLQQQLERVRHENYYDSVRLRTIDYLFD